MKPPIGAAFWGKLDLDEDGEVLAWHPLVDHCADVAAVMAALLSVRVIRRRLARMGGRNDLTPTDVARLCFFVALHDVGKVNHGFWRKAMASLLRGRAGHVREMLSLVLRQNRLRGKAHAALGLRSIVSFTGDARTALTFLSAAVSHHGKAFNLNTLPSPTLSLWEPANGRAPLEGLRNLADAARRWFPQAFDEAAAPLPSTPAFVHAFSGLAMLADWIGSDSHTSAFPFADGDETGGARFESSLARAQVVLAKLGLDPSGARHDLKASNARDSRIAMILGQPDWIPRPAQSIVDALPHDHGGSITVLEAETGSGKTEAALLRFVVLFEAGEVDGLYFALPTRTAATQIHKRVREAVGRVFPEQANRPPVLLAVPGYLKVDDREGRRGDGFSVSWGKAPPLLAAPSALFNDDESERFRFRGWAAENTKRYLAGAVIVGTIDQVLLSALQVSHAHLRASALLRHLLVIDEVHASDVYMTTVLEEVLHRHSLAGGHALLMSATLGGEVRNRLMHPRSPQRQPPVLEEAQNDPYPLISHRHLPMEVEATPVEFEGKSREVRAMIVGEMEHFDRVARRALDAVERGARVLVIRNTVRACVETQRKLEELACERSVTNLLFSVDGIPAPHHSRYAREDRLALDAALEAQFGKERSGRDGVVAVATQTVQQSLDLDADFMISDLCPMDVLLQRVGRLHRHKRANRPHGFDCPEVVVLTRAAGNLESLLREDGTVSGYCGLGNVYEDLRILDATLQVLKQQEVLRVPKEARSLVELTVHSQALEALIRDRDEKWQRHRDNVTGSSQARRSVAHLNLFRFDERYGSKEVGSLRDEKIPTRLGESDRRVEFEEALPSPFGTKLQQLSIDGRIVGDEPGDTEATQVKLTDKSLRFAFGSTSFIYDRLGLRRDDKAS